MVNAEQAETVRKIYELYLSGQTLRNIKETLETGGFKNSAGTTEWTTSNLRTILSDEKTAVTSCSRRPSFETASASRSSVILDSFPCI